MTTTDDRRIKAQTDHDRRVQEAEEREAAHRELIRRNKEANDARFGPDAAEVQRLRQACEDYDPAALRRDVVDAGTRLREALAETPALRALVDLIAAMVAENRAAGAYRDNAESAGIAKADRKRAPNGLTDHTGRAWSMVDELPLHYLPKVIVEAGLEQGARDREDGRR